MHISQAIQLKLTHMFQCSLLQANLGFTRLLEVLIAVMVQAGLLLELVPMRMDINKYFSVEA